MLNKKRPGQSAAKALPGDIKKTNINILYYQVMLYTIAAF